MEETTETTKPFMTLPEAAVYLGMARTTLYDYARRGLIPAERTSAGRNGRYVFHRAELERWRREGRPPSIPVLPARDPSVQQVVLEVDGVRFTIRAEPVPTEAELVEPKIRTFYRG